MRLATFNSPSPKISLWMQKSRRYLVHRPSFCPKFCSIATGVNRRKCSLQHSMAHPRNSPPYRRKNLADIFYTSRVIANFVPNFVAMVKKRYMDSYKNFCVYFTHLPGSPPWRDLHKILHDEFPRQYNQPCQILSQSGQGF